MTDPDNDLRLIHIVCDYLEQGYDLKAARKLAQEHHDRMQNREVQLDADEDRETFYR